MGLYDAMQYSFTVLSNFRQRMNFSAPVVDTLTLYNSIHTYRMVPRSAGLLGLN